MPNWYTLYNDHNSVLTLMVPTCLPLICSVLAKDFFETT